MAEVPEEILHWVGARIYEFKSLVERLHRDWPPDDFDSIHRQLLRYAQAIQHIVDASGEGDVDVTQPWDLVLTAADLTGSNLLNPSPTLSQPLTDSQLPFYGITNADCEQWAGARLIDDNLGGPALGVVPSRLTPLQLTDQRAKDSRKRNRSDESGIEHELPSATINPALLQRKPTSQTHYFTDPQVNPEILSSSTNPQSATLPSTLSQTDHVQNGDDHLTLCRSTAPTTADLEASRSLIGRPRGRAAGPKTSCCALYRSITGPGARVRLIEFISSMREAPFSPGIRCGPTSLPEVFHMLDTLELVRHAQVLWRRMLLFRLSQHHYELFEVVGKEREASPTTSRIQRQGRPRSEVLDILMQESYPLIANHESNKSLDVTAWRARHKAKRKSVSNRLHAAKNWRKAVDRFKLGILALFPFGEEFTSQSSEYETLKEEDCKSLLDVLEKEEGALIALLSAQLTPFVQALCDGEELTLASQNELIVALSHIAESSNGQHDRLRDDAGK
ncbi:hypothetical protein CLCR_10036 [Cladophialophora carrionii]|uniref:Uncharacterized protein n=1 Tax=Cladophialophora carrionii TaxID=86049 RepID=A0A1C1CV28_9EURO|nr:hypothetical protein CLCR_10036 [Cladophialophora carrionii]